MDHSVGTVVLQRVTIAPLARALKHCEFRPQVADTNWKGISQSRVEGLNIYYGNPLSDHAERYIDLIGVGVMLAGK